jgi:hypothetical protein
MHGKRQQRAIKRALTGNWLPNAGRHRKSQRDCGKLAAYPQHQMCKSRFFA